MSDARMLAAQELRRGVAMSILRWAPSAGPLAAEPHGTPSARSKGPAL
jgi:hypothetical protein